MLETAVDGTISAMQVDNADLHQDAQTSSVETKWGRLERLYY